MKYFYVTPEEAKKMKEVLGYLKEKYPQKDILSKCRELEASLKGVRNDVDYSPFRGYQVPIKDSDSDFFKEVWLLVEEAMQLGKGDQK